MNNNIIGILISINSAGISAVDPLPAYVKRVIADGGTVEGKGCLANSLISLGYDSNNQLSEQYADDFIDRVVADSGSVEDRRCLVGYINNLLNL
jgi:hypothetical protein